MRTAGNVRLSEIGRELVKYGSRSEGAMGRDFSTELGDSTLARKAARESEGTRTANRHRWMRRES